LRKFALAKLTSVVKKSFDQLTKEDKSGHEKFESDDEMLATYSKYYGKKVDGKTKLKIVKFELLTGGKYVEATCPYLVDNKCSIYENRMMCCRNHPQDNGYCAETDCLIHGMKRNTEESSKLCLECGSKCCKRILVPVGQDVTKKFIESWLDIDCETCGEIFNLYFKKKGKK
jgi:Fe-S-cluster containining protein